MHSRIGIHLELVNDGPNAMSYQDCTRGLEEPWYSATGEQDGSVTLNANPEGFEFLARVFLKLARTPQPPGFHVHIPLVYQDYLHSDRKPELTLGIPLQRSS
jgi:hypothetical protein